MRAERWLSVGCARLPAFVLTLKDALSLSLCVRSEQRQPAELIRSAAVGQHRGCVRPMLAGKCVKLSANARATTCGAEYKATLHKKYSEAAETTVTEAKA